MNAQCCDKGVAWVGPVSGSDGQLGGLRTFISKPPQPTNKAAILISGEPEPCKPIARAAAPPTRLARARLHYGTGCSCSINGNLAQDFFDGPPCCASQRLVCVQMPSGTTASTSGCWQMPTLRQAT